MHNALYLCICSPKLGGGFVRTESEVDVKGKKQDTSTTLSSRKLKRRRSIIGYTAGVVATVNLHI